MVSTIIVLVPTHTPIHIYIYAHTHGAAHIIQFELNYELSIQVYNSKSGIMIIIVFIAPPQPYQPPFFDVVAEQPTLEIMREAVVDNKHRPLILPSWTAHNVSRARLTNN